MINPRTLTSTKGRLAPSNTRTALDAQHDDASSSRNVFCGESLGRVDLRFGAARAPKILSADQKRKRLPAERLLPAAGVALNVGRRGAGVGKGHSHVAIGQRSRPNVDRGCVLGLEWAARDALALNAHFVLIDIDDLFVAVGLEAIEVKTSVSLELGLEFEISLCLPVSFPFSQFLSPSARSQLTSSRIYCEGCQR